MVLFFWQLLKDTFTTSFTILKIMVPVSIVVKILEMAGWLPYFGYALSPLMKLVGLPGATGLVWASAMLSNIYGGMIAYAAIAHQITLTEAQITVLSLMMLVAHTFPIELQVAYKAGVRLPVIFLIRFGFALLAGGLLNMYYTITGTGSQVSTFQWLPQTKDPSLLNWVLAELERYFYVVVVIFTLLLMMRILKLTGFLDFMSRALEPLLGALGISRTVIPMTVIGLTTGLLYGGALIIKESKMNQVPKLDIFYAMLLMGLCHALIEDSLLMIALGAQVFGVVVFRLGFSFLITYLIVRLVKKFPQEKMEKLLTR